MKKDKQKTNEQPKPQNQQKEKVEKQAQHKQDVKEQNKDEKVEINERVEALEKELANEKDKYVRLYAEFINFQNRTKREKRELIETASEDVIKALLPVLDDFERALTEMKKAGENDMAKGVQLIYDKLIKTLRDQGLQEIIVQKGDDFNPDLHEAVAQIPGDEKMKGKIHDIIQKGYKLGDKIIRYPKVVTVQ